MALLNSNSNNNPGNVVLNTNTMSSPILNGAASILGGDDPGLPSSNIPSGQLGTPTRQIVKFFIPEVGIVSMYINPQSINYSYKKIINKEMTKGGFIIQYWGEDLAKITMAGHTGSSGVNGLNVLHEAYRAEQYLFDPIALSMAANNSITGLSDLIDSTIGNAGGLSSSISQATNGAMQLNPTSQFVLPQNIPSLASIALGIEMYWSGWIMRGYFEDFSFSESAEKLGLFNYSLNFIVTQRRGYRTNSLPWQHSAIDGPSNSSVIPYSIIGLEDNTPKTTGTIIASFPTETATTPPRVTATPTVNK